MCVHATCLNCTRLGTGLLRSEAVAPSRWVQASGLLLGPSSSAQCRSEPAAPSRWVQASGLLLGPSSSAQCFVLRVFCLA